MSFTAQELARRADEWLDTARVPDYPGAMNGLQLDREGDVRRLGAAVDFCRVTIDAAIARGVDVLIVHHGMFWGGVQRLTGVAYDRVRLAITHDIGIYASHLPLDVHPEFGNNALLAHRLGLEPSGGFNHYESVAVGLTGRADVATSDLIARADELAHEHGGRVRVSVAPDGRRTRRWALCTGAGATSDSIREARALGVDTLIVGEGPHHTAVDARDGDVLVIYAGHYATETLGVQALASRLSQEYGVPWVFLPAPTGL